MERCRVQRFTQGQALLHGLQPSCRIVFFNTDSFFLQRAGGFGALKRIVENRPLSLSWSTCFAHSPLRGVPEPSQSRVASYCLASSPLNPRKSHLAGPPSHFGFSRVRYFPSWKTKRCFGGPPGRALLEGAPSS